VITKLVDSSGKPIEGATIINKDGSFGVSEPSGSIQFSILEHQKSITFALPDNGHCKVSLPEIAGKDVFFNHQMVCLPVQATETSTSTDTKTSTPPKTVH